MPFAPIDKARIQIFYQDSGVPIFKDRPYTTLVAVHGFGWNSCEDFVIKHLILGRFFPDAPSRHV